MNAPLNAVIYTRVSDDRNEGRSVEDQERECRAECERQKWPVRKVFSDNNLSASRYGKARPEWERLKKNLRTGDVLVMWEASRASRDLEEFVRLRNQCAELSVPLSYSGRVMDLTLGDDRFVGGLDALIAERESEQIRVRTLRGKRAGAKAGRPAGRVPWGYRVASPGVWEPDPAEAPRIRECVERILAGESHNAVYKWLQTTEGYVPPSLTVMCRSLRKPSLAGIRVHQGEVVGKGNWTPIITEQQHTRLVARMERVRKAHNGRNANPGPEPKHLLSLIARCGKCGEPMAWRRNRHGVPIYGCSKGDSSRLAEPLDKAVEKALFDLLAGINPKEFEDDDPAIAALWAEVERLETELEEWTEKAIAGDVTPTSFGKIEKGLLQRIEDLKEKAIRDDREQIDLADLLANWEDTPMREKRSIIRAFFSITVKPLRQGTKATPDDVDIVPL
ncbi:recombinase family protein [Mycobacterium sp. JS623]|uniref:recombinase family protein n=1 Tax=Mycobacterium sp. JS623 TaxID=212767 RepID=UPI0012F8A726|nr:recombinase family protein [Mycobacterium sp. JS623]